MNSNQTNSQLTTFQPGKYAGFFTRLVAFMVDVFIVGILVVFASWLFRIISGMLQIRNIFSHIPILKVYYDRIVESPLDRLALFLFVIGYFIFFWAIIGQTPGKAVFGIRVIPVRGVKVGLGRAILRYIGYWISTAGLFLGFLWILVDDRRQGWHDKISGTYVVYTWNARPDEKFLVEEIEQFGK